MSSGEVVFHGDHCEIVDFLNETSTKMGLCLTVIFDKPHSPDDARPYSAVIKEFVSLADIAQRDATIAITKRKPDLKGKNEYEFVTRNFGCTLLNCGSKSKEKLFESRLSFLADDDEQIALGRKLCTALRKITNAGARAKNIKRGHEAFVKNHRYTSGAKELYINGVTMDDFVGSTQYFFEA